MNNRDKKNKKDKLIIWALYDDAESSTGKACHDFFKDKAIVYSIGINDLKWDKNSNWIYKKIDLSLNNINYWT